MFILGHKLIFSSLFNSNTLVQLFFISYDLKIVQGKFMSEKTIVTLNTTLKQCGFIKE